VVFFVFPVFPTMPARALAFASLLLATGLNTVVGNSDAEAAACSNGGLSTFCANACPPSATTCGKQLDGSTRLTDATAPGSCADCTTGWAATGTDDCFAHTTCGKQLDGSTRLLTGATATAPGSCAECTDGWVDWNTYGDNSGTFDCIAHTICGKQLDGSERAIRAAGNPGQDIICDECYPNTRANADKEDCRGGGVRLSVGRGRAENEMEYHRGRT